MVWHESLNSQNDMAVNTDRFVGTIPDLGLFVLPNATGWAGLTFPALGWPGGAPQAVIASTDSNNDWALCKGFAVARPIWAGLRPRSASDRSGAHFVVGRS